MSDLVCSYPPESNPYQSYTPASPAQQASEPEEKKAVSVTRDKVSVNNKLKGHALSELGFYDEQNLVCEMPAQTKGVYRKLQTVSSQAPLAEFDHESLLNRKSADKDFNGSMCLQPSEYLGEKAHLSPALFISNLENSKIVMDMQLELHDKNGINNLASDDIEGKVKTGNIDVNRELFDQALLGVKGYISKDGNRTTTVKDVSFNKSEKAYVFDLNVEQKALGIPVFWDNFQIKFKVDNKGQLTAQLKDNWLPDSKILDKLEGIVKDKIKSNIPDQYKNFQVNLKKEKDKLTIIPEIKALEVPVSANSSVSINHIDGEKARFRIDNQGNLKISLKDVSLKGSSYNKQGKPASGSSKPDDLEVDLKFGLRKDNNREVYAKGSLTIDLDSEETGKVIVGHESLGNYFKSGTVLNDFSVYLNQSPGKLPEVQSKNYVFIENARIDGNEEPVNLLTSLKLNLDPVSGIQLERINYDDKQFNLNTSTGGVELFVNGSEYFPEMKKMMQEAKKSIDMETFMLHNDPSGQEIAYILARKAAGLNTDKDLKAVKDTPEGIKVKFIFNSWKGSVEGGKESEELLRQNIEKVEKEIRDSGLTSEQKASAIKNLHDNFKWKFFTNGILRSDHRKVFVVDGSQATVGGMNLGSQYLSANAYHDTMLKVAGPEVRKIHKEFLENWVEFNGLQQPTEIEWNSLLKTDKELTRELKQLQSQGKYRESTKMSVLVTDDKQVEIEKGILKLIEEAEHEINIEQAFFSHARINEKLEQAIKKGVKINVIVAEDSLNDMFDYANLYSVYQLAKAKKEGAKGDIKLYYYNNDAGSETKHIHTKAISADGNKAVIGSANMINRSLSSPFIKIENDGTTSQTLYNKELSLYVEDKTFIKEINSRLFEKDMVLHSRELGVPEIEEMVKKLGGESELKKKALMAKLT